MTPPRLRMIDVRKSFGATRALQSVSFEVAPGETHTLIGENGAGKSTLMKILSGACRPDAGQIELDGQPFHPTDPQHARRHGIAMIYQELTLAPHLSVEENILLGAEPTTWGCLNRKRRRQLAAQALAQLRHANIPLSVPVHTRTIAEQQVIEIARALVHRPKVLIMDEPTSSLTQVDTETLFTVIRGLQTQGVSLVYISHFLEECQRIGNRFTVLRDGKTVGGGLMSDASLTQIIRLMVGRELDEIYPRTHHPIGPPLLSCRSLAGMTKPRSVSFTLHSGEILGIAGLVGAGRTETVRVCFGLDRLAGGTIMVDGKWSPRRHPARRLAEGMGMLSENRKEEGLMLDRSLADNLTLTRFGPLSRWGFISSRRQQKAARHWIAQLDIRTQSPNQPMSELSGGNQQKIAIGRLLYHDARVLLLDEPTRGVDVGSKAQIYRLMGQLATQGKAILFISSYLPELLGICDNIAVMCRGVLSETRPASAWNEHSLIAAAIGQSDPSA
jgi:ribose transport system ATP-binding protein